MRLHIKGISQSLSESVEELQERIEKCNAQIIEPIELHHKLDNIYAFVSIQDDVTVLEALKRSLNNHKFKGSTLQIDIARPDFKERWKQDQQKMSKEQPDHWLNKDQLKRKYSTTENRQIDVIPGRLRTSPRDLKNAFVRYKKKDGTIVRVHAKKQKLWGFQKDKKLVNLVYRFVDGIWKDGDGEAVESVASKFKSSDGATASKQIASNTSLSIQKGSDTSQLLSTEYEDADIGEDEREERRRNESILDGMLKNFVQPQIDLEGERIGQAFKDDFSGTGEVIEMPENDSGPIRHVVKGQYLADSDDDNDDNDGHVEKFSQDEKEDEDLVRDSSIESKSASSPEDAAPDSNDSIEASDSRADQKPKTETLRSLFQPSSAPFTLFGNDESEHEDAMEVDQKTSDQPINPPARQIQAQTLTAPLFFVHKTSPYLVTQSQISKLKGKPVDLEEWNKTFHEQRGSMNRAMRKRRKDVASQLSRKSKVF